MQPKNDEYMLEPHSKKLFAVQFIRVLYSRFTIPSDLHGKDLAGTLEENKIQI
jgi:hypothetical protein